ncbi:MAG: COG4223 family protein [Alphaproteobacteria bacterium]
MDNIKDISAFDTEFIISKFGGIRPMAQKLGVPVSTVQGWKQRQTIPQNRMGDILEAAKNYNLELTPKKTNIEEREEEFLHEKGSVIPSQTYVGRSQSNRLVFFISFIALIIGLGCAGWLFWSDGGNKTELNLAADITKVNKRLNKLELSPIKNDLASFRKSIMDEISSIKSDITVISGQKSAEFVSAETAEDLLNNLKNLENKINKIYEKYNDQAEISKLELLSLKNKIYELEKRPVIIGNNNSSDAFRDLIDGPRLMILVKLLRQYIKSGDPYNEIIINLRKLFQSDSKILPYLDLLEKYSLDKTPTPLELKNSFATMKRELHKSNLRDKESSWDDKILRRLNSLIVIKRSGEELVGDSFQALLGRAETKVDRGDIEGAISELNQLLGEGERASIVWLKNASHYVNVQLALNQLEEIAIARLQSNDGNL